MKKKKNYIVLDTETLTADKLLLNLAYRIVDADTNQVVAVKDFLVSEYYNNNLFVKYAAFASEEKNKRYADLLASKAIKKHTLKKTLAIFEADVKRYNVQAVYAYNSKFDYDVIEKEAERIGMGGIWGRINKPVRDIWGYADKLICHTADYIRWAQENEVFTPTGMYLSTSVESVARYLYGDMDFTESHTAADDTRHELFILQEAAKRNNGIFEEVRPEKIPSGKKFIDILRGADGKEVSFEYSKKITRDGITTYFE